LNVFVKMVSWEMVSHVTISMNVMLMMHVMLMLFVLTFQAHLLAHVLKDTKVMV
jgi:hypothetical protein